MSPTTPLQPELDPKKSWRSGPARAALLNSPGDDWARKPGPRRLLATGYLATTLGVSGILGYAQGPTRAIGLAVGIVLVVFLIGKLNAATRGILDLKAQHIDERQRQVRGVVYERSYRITFVSMVVALIALGLAALNDLLPSDGSTWVALCYTAFFSLLMLPTLVAAWRRAD